MSMWDEILCIYFENAVITSFYAILDGIHCLIFVSFLPLRLHESSYTFFLLFSIGPISPIIDNN